MMAIDIAFKFGIFLVVREETILKGISQEKIERKETIN